MATPNPVADARKIISQRATDPKAKMFGLSDDLLAIGLALDCLEERAAINAEAHLLLFERIQVEPLKPSDIPIVRALGDMSRNAKKIALRIEHGGRCTCQECWPNQS